MVSKEECLKNFHYTIVNGESNTKSSVLMNIWTGIFLRHQDKINRSDLKIFLPALDMYTVHYLALCAYLEIG